MLIFYFLFFWSQRSMILLEWVEKLFNYQVMSELSLTETLWCSFSSHHILFILFLVIPKHDICPSLPHDVTPNQSILLCLLAFLAIHPHSQKFSQTLIASFPAHLCSRHTSSYLLTFSISLHMSCLTPALNLKANFHFVPEKWVSFTLSFLIPCHFQLLFPLVKDWYLRPILILVWEVSNTCLGKQAPFGVTAVKVDHG